MPRPKPLEGIKVLDLTRVISGPYCTRMLADCGAEIIKIEPGGGEYMRQKEPKREGESTYFGHLNAGKKSVEIDFRSRDDIQFLHQLVPHCDILVENFRPGVMTKLGLDYPSACAHAPDIIYCSISGFGQSGPRAQDPAYAPIIHALSGHDVAAMTYESALDRPATSGIWYADIIGGVFAFGAIQTALISKLRHGGGQYIDVSMIDAMINLLVLETQEAQTSSTHARWLSTPIRTLDGYLNVMPIAQRAFHNLTQVINRPEWLNDDRFSTQMRREKNWAELMGLIEQWTSLRTAAECEQKFMAASIPSARYMSISEIMDDPHIHARGLFSQVAHSSGTYQVPNLPFQFSSCPMTAAERVPELGAHSEEIMSWVRMKEATNNTAN